MAERPKEMDELLCEPRMARIATFWDQLSTDWSEGIRAREGITIGGDDICLTEHAPHAIEYREDTSVLRATERGHATSSGHSRRGVLLVVLLDGEALALLVRHLLGYDLARARETFLPTMTLPEHIILAVPLQILSLRSHREDHARRNDDRLDDAIL